MHMWLGTTSTSSPMPRCRRRLGEFSKLFLRTNFGIEASMVGDIVAVHAAGMGHQERGGITVCDPQIVQIRNHSSCLGKGKTQIELQTIGRTRDISRF